MKIFISTHKPTNNISNDIFQPIQVGTDNNDKIENIIHDNDTKDNISCLNSKFCELTAQYWVWKNYDSDYYGFFHYRRYLSFNDKNNNNTKDLWGNIIESSIDDNFITKYKLDSDNIEKIVRKYDIILPNKKNILSMPKEGKNLYEQYSSSKYLYSQDLNILLNVIENKYPDFIPYAKNYFNGHTSYFNNMFIMKKEIFQEYSSWLFDILFECNKRINYDNYSKEAFRTPGHLGERLLNIYIAYLKDKNKKLKIKELQTIFVQNTSPIIEYNPAFSKKNIPIVLSSNDFYVPYLSTTIASIIHNSNPNFNYDILIMTKDILSHNRIKIQNMVKQYANVSIRFIDINPYEDKFKHLVTYGHFSIETWFRLLMPEILPKYNKVLYLDADLVVCSDISKLYNTDILDFALAACQDADTAGLYGGFLPNKKDYIDNTLRLKDPYNYFQAGVILFNLKYFREKISTKNMIQLASARKWELLDQDVLNIVAENKIKFIDMSWNVMFDWGRIRRDKIISYAPKQLQDKYEEARKMPKIIHYAGPDKPWQNPDADFAEEFWFYLKMTPFYEQIIFRYVNTKRKTTKKIVKEIAKKIFPIETRRGKKIRQLLNS